MFDSYKKKLLLIALIFSSSIAYSQTARLQVIHNSPDDIADSVDIYLNGTMLLDNFAFRTASPFIDAPAGTPLDIAVAPKTSTSAAQAVANFNLNLTSGETYIAVADGITGLSSTTYTPAEPFDLKIYTLGRETASSSTNTDVLVHHGSTDAPTVDVFESSVPAGTIVNDAPFGAFTSYLELATQDYVLEVQDMSGSTTVASYDAPLSTLNLQGAAITVVASGFLDPSMNGNGPEFGLYVALAAGGDLIPLPESQARLQVIHNSPDDIADSVDVYLNGSLLLDNFAFRTATPFIDAPAGVEINIDIAPKTSTSVAQSIANFPLTLESGETYIAVADGITGLSSTSYNPDPAFGLEIYSGAREAATNTGNTDVLVHHGSTDAPTVDVYESSVPAGTIVDDLAYGDFQGYLELATNDYVLDIQDMTGSTTVASFSAPLSTLNLDDAAITVVASGFLDPSMNGDGPAFGLYVALATGGDLVPLPLATASIDESSLISFNIYPNPTSDVLTINAPSTVQSISIFNASGKLVKKVSSSTEVNVSELVSGSYIITVHTISGTGVQSFMKK